MNSLKSKIRVVGVDFGAPYEVYFGVIRDVGGLTNNSLVVKRRKRLEAVALKYSFEVRRDLSIITMVGVVDSIDQLKELAIEVSDFSISVPDFALGPSIQLMYPQRGKEGTHADIYPTSYSLDVFSPEELRYLYGMKAQDALSDALSYSVGRLLL